MGQQIGGSGRRLVIGVGLCALVLAAYANSFSAGFALDSRQLVLNDTRVHAVTAENVDLILQKSYWWPYGESGLYRPLTTFSYLFNYAVLGSADRPAGYHWLNLVIHAINVLLVWSLASRLSGTVAAACAAALWAVHPLSTEAVTNIAGRADLLSACGVLAGLICYLNARQTAGSSRALWLAGLAIATGIAVFAKESGVALAAAIVLYEFVWWDRRRSRRALAAGAFAAGLPILVMLAQRSVVLAAVPAAEFPFIDNPIGAAGFWAGRIAALHVVGLYVGKLVWPATLSVDYSYNQIPIDVGPLLVVSALLVLAGLAIAMWFRQAHRAAFFFLAFATATFLPASNLLFATGTIMAERLMYLPSAGVIVAAALVLFDLARSRRGVAVATVAVTLCVAAAAARTWVRNRDWKDEVTLWSTAVGASPASSKAHRALAEALYSADPAQVDFERVIAESEQSVALIASLSDELSSFQSYRQAGAAYLDRADRQRRAAGEGAPSPDVRAGYERAIVLLAKSLVVAATSSARIGADSTAQQADARRLLAAAALGLGDGSRAIDEASRARQLNPLDPRSHRMLADAYLATRQDDSAAVALMVGSMVTADTTFRANLIDLYRATPASSCALVSTANAVTIDPGCPLVHRHLCAASTESIAINERIGRQAQANALRASADQLRCR